MFISQRIDRLKFDGGVFSHIVNANIDVVMIQNVNNEKIFFFKSCRIDVIQNYKKKGCYLTISKNVHFVINSDSHKPTFKN